MFFSWAECAEQEKVSSGVRLRGKDRYHVWLGVWCCEAVFYIDINVSKKLSMVNPTNGRALSNQTDLLDGLIGLVDHQTDKLGANSNGCCERTAMCPLGYNNWRYVQALLRQNQFPCAVLLGFQVHSYMLNKNYLLACSLTLMLVWPPWICFKLIWLHTPNMVLKANNG